MIFRKYFYLPIFEINNKVIKNTINKRKKRK